MVARHAASVAVVLKGIVNPQPYCSRFERVLEMLPHAVQRLMPPSRRPSAPSQSAALICRRRRALRAAACAGAQQRCYALYLPAGAVYCAAARLR